MVFTQRYCNVLYTRTLPIHRFVYKCSRFKPGTANSAVGCASCKPLHPTLLSAGSLGMRMTQSRRLRAKSSLNMSRSQRHLDWVKSKFSSLKVRD